LIKMAKPFVIILKGIYRRSINSRMNANIYIYIYTHTHTHAHMYTALPFVTFCISVSLDQIILE
jgi:hypothetical protein